MNHNNINTQSAQENALPTFGPESHSLNVSVAMVCKSSEAGLIFNHVIFWLKHNKLNGRNQIDDRTWAYETISKMQEYLPYLSFMQIKRSLNKLVECGYLIRGNYNKNKFDKTCWYAVPCESWITGDNQKIFPMGQVRPIDGSESKSPTSPSNNFSKNVFEGSYLPHPGVVLAPSYNDKGIKQRYKKEGEGESLNDETRSPAFSKKKKSKEPNIQFGKHVSLTQEEYELLCCQLGKSLTDHYIEAINNFVPNNKPYKDYAAAIRTWWVRDKGKGQIPNEKNINNRNSSQSNEEYAEKIKKVLSSDFFHIAPTYVEFKNPKHPNSTVIEFSDKEFKKKCNKQLKFKNLEIEE